VLAGEHPAGAAEASLDFIGDEEDAVLRAYLFEPGEVILGGNDKAAFTEDRFGDEGGDAAR